MSSIQFPVYLQFKIGTLANDFVATNATGQTIAYVREKILKFVNEIDIYSDTNKSQLIYKIKADRWLDFNSNYAFTDANELFLGSLARKGWRSLWSAKYEAYNSQRNLKYLIQEENPFVKILDGLLGEIPILGFLVGYFFNPKYTVHSEEGVLIGRCIKQPSFWGRKFTIEISQELNDKDAELLFLSVTEMTLLERRRG